MRLWLDAVDDDLVLEVGDFGWFEWRELSGASWAEEVLSVASAVLNGQVVKKNFLWRTWSETWTSTGVVRRASSGRPIHFGKPGTTRFPAYSSLG